MSSPILISIIIFLIMESMIFSQESNDVFDCLPREKKALLRFKDSLSNGSRPSNILLSWKNDDCCTWQGLECNETTGHVIGLDLKNNKLKGNLIGSSLLELKYLSYLDLSFNDFQGSPIPESTGSMTQLQYLNLYRANFSGVVPHQVGNLSSLRNLNLSGGSYGNLTVDDLMWATNLTSLEYLDMSNVNISGTKDLIKVLVMLPSIIDLRMSKSGLDNTNLAHTCVNSTLLVNAQHLDLSSNSFEGNCPCFLQNMTSLSFLDLLDNRYSSCDPHFIASTNLEHLSLADNSLHHKADWVYEVSWDKCRLKLLVLGGNQFYGDISRAFQNSSRCWSDNLESLDLGLNRFYGDFPEELVNFRALRVLSLYQNRLSGEIPVSLGQLSNLEDTFHLMFLLN